MAAEITETQTYLTFTLDHEDFAVDVSGVREVLDYTTVTRVPRTPEFMKGVINLRGSVVPVIDMRVKFGLPEAEKTVDTCIIVLEVVLDEEVTVIGAIADSVKEVFDLDPGDIEPPPRLGTRMDTEFISGMGKHKDEFIIILDVNRVFSAEEMEVFRLAEGAQHPPQEGAGEGGDPLPEGIVEPFGEEEDDPGPEEAAEDPSSNVAEEVSSGKAGAGKGTRKGKAAPPRKKTGKKKS